MLWGGQPVNNQLTGYSPPVNNTLIYANTNNLLQFGIVIPVRDHGQLMVVTCLGRNSYQLAALFANEENNNNR